MGIDHNAFCGIGAEIELKSISALATDQDDSEYDFFGILKRIVPKERFSFFEIGDSYEPDYEPIVCIVVKEPFENGFTGLQQKVSELVAFLEEHKLKYEKIDCVGGLAVT